MPEVNQKAPDFTLKDQDAKERKLSEFKGQNVGLGFYPFDFWPRCTEEFGCFRDDISDLKYLSAQVLGISVDSHYAHKAFHDKLKLDFPLLADFGKEVCKLYGTLRPEGFSNRAYFIIDKHGVIKFKKIMPTPPEMLENSVLIEELKKLN